MAKFWNDLTHEAWSEENDKAWNAMLVGELTIQLSPEDYRIRTDHGDFIQVQSNCLLNEAPGVFVRSCHYGPALKVMIPKDTPTDAVIRIVRRSQSGKSYIAEIA